jgi:ArsR family transcriptional regulator, zinc-responsive transcriptional repressor
LTCVIVHVKVERVTENDFQYVVPGVEHVPIATEDEHRHGKLASSPPREILDSAGDILRALAAPVRIAIVLQLQESQRCVHELVDALEVPQPLVSQHLRILKAAGVVAGERSGREVLYRLVDHHLAHIVLDAVAHAGEAHAGEGSP